MICTKCGTQNADGAKFCSSCGSPLEAPAAPTAGPVQAPPPAPPVGAYTPPPAGQAPPMAPPPTAAPGMAAPPPPMAAPGMAAPGMAAAPSKPYKTEFVLGLIGSIIGIIIFLVMLISGITAASFSYGYYGYGFGGAAIIGSIFCLVSFILGFVGTSQLNKGNGKGGIMLTVAGGLGFLAMFFGIFVGWSTWFFFPLLLAGGIMALARRKKVESGQF